LQNQRLSPQTAPLNFGRKLPPAHAPHTVAGNVMDGETVGFIIFVIVLGAFMLWAECQGI
jgi:hypothetical protein